MTLYDLFTISIISIFVGTTGNGNYSRPHSTVKGDEENEDKWEFDGPIRRCNHADNNSLNKCLRLILKDLKPRLADGVPEINLPPMDPLHLKNIAFRHGSGPIKVIASFSNVVATGLSLYNKSEFLWAYEKSLIIYLEL